MHATLPRRSFLKSAAAAFLFGRAAEVGRLGIMCQFDPEETAARKVLAAARRAGFRRTQIQFPWDRATPAFLRQLPGWLAEEEMRVDVLSAYVNCAAPENVLMDARAEDLARAIDLAPAIGATRLIAWTGGYGKGLMTADPRNFLPEASDGIRRFLEPSLKKLEAGKLILALETYVTLTCPDGSSLRQLLDRLPAFITAVLDPPNLTPIARYAERDRVLIELCNQLEGRIGVVHLKDFRLATDGASYDLPGPLKGEMNYPLLVSQIGRLPSDIPWIAEHLSPAEFASAHENLAKLTGS